MSLDFAAGNGAGGSWNGIEAVGGVLGQGDDTVSAGAQWHDLDGGSGQDRLILDYSKALPDGRTVTKINFHCAATVYRSRSRASSPKPMRRLDPP